MPSQCPNCAAPAPDDARYCMRCGHERPEPEYVPPPPSVPLDEMTTSTAPHRDPQQPVPPPAYMPAPTPPAYVPPPTSPMPAPAPARAPARSNRVLVWAGTLAAAVVIGGGVTAGVLLLGDDDSTVRSTDDKPTVAPTDDAGSPSPTPESQTPTQTPTQSPESSAPPTSDTPTATETSRAPTGFRTVTDPAGFTLAIPELWSRTDANRGQITYAGSTGLEHLLIGVVPNAPYASSYDNFLTLEKNARAKQLDYQRLQLQPNTFQGRPGAIWEFTYTDKQTGETLRAVDQGYIAANGTDYSIYTKARDRDWRYARETFDAALAGWSLD